MKPSGNWKLLGIRHVYKREFIPFDRLQEWIRSNPVLLYKNGNPMYTVRDLDYGTVREWGNTKYHGIACIYI